MTDELKPNEYIIHNVQSSLNFWRPMTHQFYLQVGLYGFGQFRHPEIQKELNWFKNTINVLRSWPRSERKGYGIGI